MSSVSGDSHILIPLRPVGMSLGSMTGPECFSLNNVSLRFLLGKVVENFWRAEFAHILAFFGGIIAHHVDFEEERRETAK
jgi:hypothetical protein